MKLQIKNIVTISTLLVGSLWLVSCEDYLDRKPLDKVTPDSYLTKEDQLASYSIKAYSYYKDDGTETEYVFKTHSGWSIGTVKEDLHSDNMASTNASYDWWVPGNKRVPNKAVDNDGLGDYSFKNIRNSNYFFELVLPRYENGTIEGNIQNIEHYIGEMYFLRAWEYFKKLRLYGDFPIVKSTLTDEQGLLVGTSQRAPRNEVARFIIQDLDSAIMLMQPVFKNKNRLSSTVAELVKSRVALYEASWLTYHKGTPFVPGGSGWPGEGMEYNKDFSIDIDAEIDYFLTQAMDASKNVAESIQLANNTGVMNPSILIDGWNPYFEMFGAVDMGKYNEVLLWRAYSQEMNVLHGVGTYVRLGNDYGLTKGYVDGFLMKNGLPWYAVNSGYQGDKTIQDVKKDRDERLQLFLKDPTTLIELESGLQNGMPNIVGIQEQREVTGYAVRKCFNYDPAQSDYGGAISSYGCIIFRGVEAHLNYLEASYMKNKSLDATAQKYWRAVRERAGVDPDFNKTIQATNLSMENDWAVYSAGQPVDATLFNIRRERRNEFIGENMRWDDLRRWRALDQVQNYTIEGFNLWDEMYASEKYTDPKTGKSLLIEPDGGGQANVSSRTSSKYLRPYQIIRTNNEVYDGYNWSKANYLTPLPAYEIMLTSSVGADGNVNMDSSPLYQNPYWPKQAGGSATE